MSTIFLGDIVGDTGDKGDLWRWYGELSTEITCWVPGNHDPIARSEYDNVDIPTKAPFYHEFGDYTFRFKHRPHRGEDGNHWIVHGHKHNEKPEEYPFIDPESQRINVSASMIGFEPIRMERIVELLESGKRYRVAP